MIAFYNDFINYQLFNFFTLSSASPLAIGRRRNAEHLFEILAEIARRAKAYRAPGNYIDRVTFSNISVDEASAPHMLPSRIADHDSSHNVRSYNIQQVMYGNRPHDSRVDELRERK